MFNLMLNHELNNGHHLRRLKSTLLKLRSLLRRKKRVDVATFAVARVTLLLHALSITYPTPSLIDDVYSLRKDRFGNVFAKYVGTQSGVKKRTIWVAKGCSVFLVFADGS